MRLRKVTPDKEKVQSILKMVDTTLRRIQATDLEKFATHITKDYYEILMELMTSLLLLHGYKTQGEGSHLQLIQYIHTTYPAIQGYEIALLDDLRIVRNKIAYDGFFVEPDYFSTRKKDIELLIKKLKSLILTKMATPTPATQPSP